MDLQLNGKLAVVTGGSRGIGHACAVTLKQKGARVVLVAKNPQRLARIPDFTLSPGAQVEVHPGKVNLITRLPLVWKTPA